jgi:hypothetical protein
MVAHQGRHKVCPYWVGMPEIIQISVRGRLPILTHLW